MEIRIIKSDDYGCGFNQLLTEFCRMPINISLESFVEKLKNPIAVYAGVFTDSKSLCDASAPEGFSKSLCDASAPERFSKSKMVAFGSVYFLNKIHYDKHVGVIEDIIVDPQYRHFGLGTKLIKFLIDQAKQHECYKVELYCLPELERFYQNANLIKHGIEMRQMLN